MCVAFKFSIQECTQKKVFTRRERPSEKLFEVEFLIKAEINCVEFYMYMFHLFICIVERDQQSSGFIDE